MKLPLYVQNLLKSHQSSPLPRSVWTNPLHFIGCGFGIGALPLMPGTYATLFSVLVYLLLAQLSWFYYLVIVVVLNLIGVWLCGKTNRDFGEKDHPGVCYDEIAAFLICFIGIPLSWLNIVIAFILFRILDIAKPGPIGFLEDNVPGGWGVMLDDIAAAIITLIVLHLINLF